MQRSFTLKPLLLSLILLSLFPAHAQDKPSSDTSQQAKPDQTNEPMKSPELTTNDTPTGRETCKSLSQAPLATAKQDPALRAFLHSIEGRWNSGYFRQGNKSWWPDHGGSASKNEIHYLFGPQALLFELRPEFALPSITGCYLYGSGHKVSAELFDLELHKPSASAATQTVRFKLSPDHKKLEMALDADTNLEPTIQVLEFRSAGWSPSQKPQ